VSGGGNVRRGLVGYLPVNSTLQQLSPPTKLLIFIFLAAASSFVYLVNLYLLIVVLAAAVVLFSFARLPRIWVRLVFLAFGFEALGTFVTYTLIPPSSVPPTAKILYSFSWFIVTDQALITVAHVVMLFFSMAFLALFLIGSTTERDIVEGINFFRLPRTIGLMFGMIFRLAGILFTDYDTVREAQLSRGIDYRQGSFLEKLRRFFGVMVPLIVLAFRRAAFSINALDSRGWAIRNVKKTTFHQVRLHALDYVVLSPFVVILIASILTRLFPWGF
jgi:energy-coupling factor transport system permease protein